MKQLQQRRILHYCDEPLLIDAIDDEGRVYLCERMPDAEGGAQFVVVEVADEDLRKFEERRTCLRGALLAGGGQEWYVSVPQRDFRGPFAVEAQESRLLESPSLPRMGIMYDGAWGDNEQR